MADKDKSIIERAILDAKRIQEALNANTKEILRSVAKEEIDGIVKESLQMEDLYEVEDVAEAEEEEEVEDTEAPESEEEEEEEVEDAEEDSEEEEEDIEDLDSEEGDDLEGNYDGGMGAMASGDEFEMDMTDASDDDVIAVYKKLTGDDEIEVVYDAEDDELEVKVTEPGDFIVKNVSKGAGAEADDFEGSDEFGSEEGLDSFEDDSENEDDLDEMMYEIEMEEGEDLMEEEVNEEEEEEEEEKLEEGGGRNLSNGRNQTLKPDNFPKSLKRDAVDESTVSKKALTESENKYKALLTEAKELKGRNEEYKTALKTFRTMLAETVVYNSNLTYVTKLFMEHSTTKDEKQTILKRFDEEVSTLKESQRLYKTIVNELSSKAPIKESIDKTITKDVATGTSKQLNESTAYIDKETSRIMDLMRRVENR
jgi:hypothetical protein